MMIPCWCCFCVWDFTPVCSFFKKNCFSPFLWCSSVVCEVIGARVFPDYINPDHATVLKRFSWFLQRTPESNPDNSVDENASRSRVVCIN